MARIPESEIERLKAETDLVSLVRRRGIELKKHGAGGDLVGLCPFHDDHEPSLVVSPGKNLWHCLGACQAGGDVIQWVMKAEGVSFRHAVELLRDGLPGVNGKRSYTTTRRLDAPVEPTAEDHELMGQVVDYYHRALKANAEALAYLQGRGIHSGEAIERFKIGLADRTLGLRLPAKQIKAGAEIRARLQKLGIVRQSGHEHFNGSIVFPVFDAQGQVVEMYGRKITKGLRKGTPLHLYLPGPHAGVWNMEQGNATEDIILCESLIDALTFWCAGYRNVTASYGVEGFTDEHIAAFRRCDKRRVLIAYDRDEAGDSAAEKLAAELTQEGFDCYRVQFPKGMDVNEYALKVTPAAQSLGLVIRKAAWMGKGKAPSTGPNVTAVAGVNEATKETKGEKKGQASDGSASSTKAAKERKAKAEETAPPSVSSPSPESNEGGTPPASPVPEHGKDVEAEVKTSEVVIRLGDRSYRVRGVAKNMSYDQLKVNVLARRGEAFHVDTFDLYAARPRATFIKLASGELGVEEKTVKKDLGKVLLKLEQLQDEQITAALAPKEKEVTIKDADKAAALELLKDPHLLDRVLLVANPFAEQLTFLDDKTRRRRDHVKYLTLIRAVALLHQYQRPVKTTRHNGQPVRYIEVTPEDIAVAHRLADQVLGRSTDELAPQTRKLLVLIVQMVTERCGALKMDAADYRFTRRELRERTGWGQTQLRIHLERLVEMEYLLVHRGGRGQTFVYELLHDGRGLEGQPTLAGLADVTKLNGEEQKQEYDKKLAGAEGELAGPKRGQNGSTAGSKRAAENATSPAAASGSNGKPPKGRSKRTKGA